MCPQISQTGWDLATSRKNYQQVVRNEQQHFLPDHHPLFTGVAPTSVNIRIVEAPAEFAIPVKQDRWVSHLTALHCFTSSDSPDADWSTPCHVRWHCPQGERMMIGSSLT